MRSQSGLSRPVLSKLGGDSRWRIGPEMRGIFSESAVVVMGIYVI
jgi:hypothetical protein